MPKSTASGSKAGTARKDKPKLSKPIAVPKPQLSSRTKPSSSAHISNHSSDEDDGEEAKFDISTIPIHRLTLDDPTEDPVTGTADEVAETDVAQAAEEDKAAGKKVAKPFPFLQLPSELRVRVYGYHFEGVDPVLDLSPDNYRKVHRKLAFLRTCRHIYVEASHFFYSAHVFRIFPTYPGRFFKTRRPLLARLRRNQRVDLTELELRLGPGFNKPPKCWAVTRKLGLHECANVRKIRVFVQLDPSVSWLDGFRKPGFYEAFSSGLLDDILKEARAVEVVELDGYESVRKAAPIMQALVQVARDHGKKIVWGPRNGWTETADNEANSRAATNSTTTQPSLEAIAALLDQGSELVLAA
ncbi:hypothetical protein CMQ_6064 [Grosmannia clavigera kw1407]|uniref:Uncharacterized protein n=1 Tax=Grosmannia clavigera (strain kw1407 / UAMH 11150) TaxID=655863 RepID=F0XMQ7_GROCL|nr:uncharacterized protein CMQ_6064 [Grosmannia clavigera kw1407]EFX01122.1 hypothetical protein CMQ_6064 [Grosmannia clavigera kw1407]